MTADQMMTEAQAVARQCREEIRAGFDSSYGAFKKCRSCGAFHPKSGLDIECAVCGGELFVTGYSSVGG